MRIHDRWIPAAGVDVNRPCPAREYDFLLGGLHNFPADRWSALRATEDDATLHSRVLANRAFLQRAVRHLLAAGVRQFLDLGSGIPASGHVHEIVHLVDPGFPVAYVDVDPVAVAHATAMLDGIESVAAVCADLRDVPQVFAAPAIRRLIDLTRPVGVIAVDVLHRLADAKEPADVVGRYREAVSVGSYLVISHPVAESGEPRDGGAWTPDGARAIFAGWELVRPGLVPVTQWYADDDAGPSETPQPIASLAGVAKKL
jgi:hypothetical protein